MHHTILDYSATELALKIKSKEISSYEVVSRHIERAKKIGIEFKYTDNPKTTKSMHIALNDLKLDHIYIVVPGNNAYLLDEKISVCGIDALENIFK